MSSNVGSRINTVRTVGVPVGDTERALDFYTSKLGMEKRMDATFGPGQRWVEVAPSGSATTIALTPPGQTSPGRDTGIRLTTDDASAEHARLRTAGVDVDDELLRIPNVPPMFSFRDPDGNQLYIVEGS